MKEKCGQQNCTGRDYFAIKDEIWRGLYEGPKSSANAMCTNPAKELKFQGVCLLIKTLTNVL